MDEQERRDTIASALDQLPMLVAITSGDDQRLVTINGAGRTMMGDRGVGAPLSEWSDLFGQQLIDQYHETWRSAEPHTARAWRMELEGPDGEPFEVYLDFTISPVFGPAGEVRAVLGFGQDVTDRVRQQQRSSELERQMVVTTDLLAALQDAMLPKGLPVPQRVEMSARYLLAEDYTGAGGDWFDAIPLPGERVVVAVGDVVGHGLEASVAMGELKTLFDASVRGDGDIVAALEVLDARAHRVRDARAATICACLVDTVTGEVSYCTAGHPPPVVIRADGTASYLPVSGAGPLCSGEGFAVARHQLAPGDVLLLYSDGLVERPGRSPGRNTVELLQAAEAAAPRTGPGGPPPGEQVVERVCRRALELLTRLSGYADDITILGLQLVPETPPLELHLPAVPDAVRTVRTDLSDWLTRLRVSPLDVNAVQHAVNEIVSNAVMHAYESVDARNPIDVTARLTGDGQVEVVVSDRGRWRPPVRNGGGRGLAMARGFLDSLRIDHGDEGTTVWAEHRVSHPSSLLRGTATAVAEQRPRSASLSVVDDVVRVAGVLDLRSADDFRHACSRASRGGTRPLTVDLTEVDLLSSAAVQALYDTRAAGPVELVAPLGSPAQHVLDLVHLPYRS